MRYLYSASISVEMRYHYPASISVEIRYLYFVSIFVEMRYLYSASISVEMRYLYSASISVEMRYFLLSVKELLRVKFKVGVAINSLSQITGASQYILNIHLKAFTNNFCQGVGLYIKRDLFFGGVPFI